MSLSVQHSKYFSPIVNTVKTFFFGSNSRIALTGLSALSLLALTWKTLSTRSANTYKFEFASWNIGRYEDFLKCLGDGKYASCSATLPSLPKEQPMTDEESTTIKNSRIELILQRIQDDGAHILALQELSLSDVQHPLFAAWMTENHFSIFFDSADTAILFRNDLFEGLTPMPCLPGVRGHTYISTVFRNRTKDTTIAVGSAHISGFSLGTPEEDYGRKNGREYHIGDREFLTFAGRQSETSTNAKINLCIFGADTNARPKIKVQKPLSLTTATGEIACPPRPDIPTTLFGFTRPTEIHDQQTTAFNPDLGEANLDQIYVKQNPNHDDDRQLSCSVRPLASRIDPPSDHKIIHVTVQMGPSFWKTLLHVIGIRPLNIICKSTSPGPLVASSSTDV